MTYNLLNDTLNFNTNTGVYTIFWIIDSTPVCINRLLGADKEGILYIGKSIDLKNRLENIKSSIKNKNNKHHFGIKYNKEGFIPSKIKMEDLYISFCEYDNPKCVEEKQLTEYFKIYGELPPFNSNF